MDNFKIKHFEKDNPSKKFPEIHSLSLQETESICQKLSEKLGLNSQDPKFIIDVIDKKGVILKEFNANDDGFLLSAILSHLSIQPRKNVYINWYRYDQIDEMTFDDLNNYFNYIWYPASDDIDIFDSSYSWIVTVSHEGYVKFVEKS
ncbi:MAG: hypothetical protein C4526_01135 [Nitrospiraceae bacterium]|nr:MAG: hypothetical protein C4526_01135 [Nitrospiraceae bacterium]